MTFSVDHGPGFNAFGSASTVDRSEATDVDEREKLSPYFATRHDQHERIRLIELEVSRVAPRSWLPLDEDVAGIQFALLFEADDLAGLGGGNRVGGGKGAVACRDGRILLMSFGLDTAERYHGARMCPRARRRARPVACTQAN